MFALGVIIAISILVSCGEDQVPKICLEAPCGEVDSATNNISVLLMNPDDNVTNVNLVIDEELTSLSLDGIDYENSKFSSCWQTIPEFNDDSIVIIGYELDGEQIIGFANHKLTSSNFLILQISGDAAILQDYEKCIDII